MLVCLKVCQQQEQLPEDAAKDMQNIYNVKIEFVHSLLTKVLNGEAQFFFGGWYSLFATSSAIPCVTDI